MGMKNVDMALAILAEAIPGLQVSDYKTTADTFNMKLERDGVIIPCEGHVTRLRNIDSAFIEKVRAAFDGGQLGERLREVYQGENANDFAVGTNIKLPPQA